jgi:hypothetical protein
VRREVWLSAKWAFFLVVPISLFGWAFSFAIAHSSSMFPLLFYWPAYLFMFVADEFKLSDRMPEGFVLTLAFAAQFIGYFLMVFAFRVLVLFFRRYET